ncbi:MAG TPA: dUTP diphosphatase [Vicinamibacterales bacterium]|nr:dUTP diphosphatase [Vicinamibacterales bacterium]
MRLTVTRLRPSVRLPVYSSPGAAGFDLAAADDVDIGPGEIRLVGTGLVVAVPEGYFLAIVARSSTPLKRGLVVANGVGVVDSDYCGPADEVKIQLLNVTSEPVSVKAGDRLAQGIVLQAPRVTFVEGEAAGPSRGGFGSTGN